MSSLHFQIAENEDEAEVKTAAKGLIDRGWKLEDGIQLEKTFFFKNHQSSVDLFNMISIKSKKVVHHPKVISTFRQLEVHWTTHKPFGLTQKDITMAEYSDEAAEMIGTVAQEDASRCG